MPIYAMSGARSNHPDGVELTVVEDAAAHVVEITGDDPMLVCIVEQVAVDLAAFGLTLDDLIAMAGAVTGDVPVLGADGLWRAGAPTAAAGWRHEQSEPLKLVQIQHRLTYYPAGITAVDTLGRPTMHSGISHPAVGVTELTYGAPFAGTIYLS